MEGEGGLAFAGCTCSHFQPVVPELTPCEQSPSQSATTVNTITCVLGICSHSLGFPALARLAIPLKP